VTSQDPDDRKREIAEWAERLAATLPPFTDDECVQLGLIAAQLDARAQAQEVTRVDSRRTWPLEC
jgi:hypothetical protein